MNFWGGWWRGLITFLLSLSAAAATNAIWVSFRMGDVLGFFRPGRTDAEFWAFIFVLSWLIAVVPAIIAFALIPVFAKDLGRTSYWFFLQSGAATGAFISCFFGFGSGVFDQTDWPWVLRVGFIMPRYALCGAVGGLVCWLCRRMLLRPEVGVVTDNPS